MPLQLFKLAGKELPSITTSQVDQNYFHTWSRTASYVTFVAGTSVSLTSLSLWFNGAGTSITGFVTGGGKECLEINGVMQQAGLYSVATDRITLIAPAGGLTLQKGYPITLQSYNAATIVSTTRTYAVP